jgi:hypothetical protein
MDCMEKFAVRNMDGEDPILAVRAEFVHSEPAIWRHLEIRSSTALNQVHQVLQAAFGWEDAHLDRFTPDHPIAPLRPVDGEVPEVLQWLPGQQCEERRDRPEEDCSLVQLLALGSGAVFYEYDFGDSWLHRLELGSHRPANDDAPPARLIDGTRRGPLEDSGGFPGYEEIMVPWPTRLVLTTPNALHGCRQNGSDGSFDPAFLDIAAVNRALADQFGPLEFG